MDDLIPLLLVSFAIFGLLVCATWLGTLEDPREAEAIQRGYALHCPQTGEFAWKGECDE